MKTWHVDIYIESNNTTLILYIYVKLNTHMEKSIYYSNCVINGKPISLCVLPDLVCKNKSMLIKLWKHVKTTVVSNTKTPTQYAII